MYSYINIQVQERQALLHKIHHIIITADRSVIIAVETLLEREMITYREAGLLKYSLCCTKKYVSLHIEPMFVFPLIHKNHEKNFRAVTFFSNCIHFNETVSVPVQALQSLIRDCAALAFQKLKRDNLFLAKVAGYNQKN